MNWVFPIAGHGTRTSMFGEYKPQIEVYPNYSILKLCLMGLKSLIKETDTLVFAASKQQEKEYSVTHNIKKVLKELNLNNNVHMAILEQTPPGQALTVKKAVQSLCDSHKKDGTFIINSDQVVFFDIESIDKDYNSVGLYFNDGTSSCFYDLDFHNKRVTNIKEKEKISCYASAGVFFFASGEQVMECIEWGQKEQKLYNNELYLGPCMEYFKEIKYFKTMIKFDLGNENSLNLFKKFTKQILIEEKR
jgi:hypothetical protein